MIFLRVRRGDCRLCAATGTLFQNPVFDGYVEKSFDVPTENMVKNGKVGGVDER